jgi:dihydrofolate reductase
MNLIFACDKKYGIGINNKLPPWKIDGDLARFSKVTIGNGSNVVIMGKNTYLSLPNNYLKNRCNIVVSQTLFNEYSENKWNIVIYDQEIEYCILNKTYIFNNFGHAYIYALNHITNFNNEILGEIWVIGGSTIYDSAIELNLVNKIYLTYVKKKYSCDVYLGEKTINFLDESKITHVHYNNHLNNDPHEFRIYNYTL